MVVWVLGHGGGGHGFESENINNLVLLFCSIHKEVKGNRLNNVWLLLHTKTYEVILVGVFISFMVGHRFEHSTRVLCSKISFLFLFKINI